MVMAMGDLLAAGHVFNVTKLRHAT